MNKNPSASLSSQMFNLVERLQGLKLDRLDPEISAKIDRVQELIGDIYLSTERNLRSITTDYSFLGRDHVFFDGENNNHSGAV